MVLLKIFLDQPLPSQDSFKIDDEFWDYYLTTVKRIRRGDSIQVAGKTHVADTTVDSTEPLRVTIDDVRAARTPSYGLHVAQSITRKKKFEETIKRGTELGVTEFTPIVSERTVREPNNPEKQIRRWRKIAMDSARITGRDWLPTINEITPIQALLPVDGDRIYVGDESGEDPAGLFEEQNTSALLIIGPEGGLSGEELESLTEEGARPVSLGDVNYRAETASMSLSVLWLNAVVPERDRTENPTQNP